MKTSFLDNLNFFIILGLTILLPIFFLPITSEFYDYNKQVLLILAAGITLIIWTVNLIVKKQVRIVRSPLGIPILALLAVWVASAVLRTPNKVDAFLESGQTGTIVALVILFFTSINSIHTRKQLEALVSVLIGSISLLAIASLLWTSGLMGKIIPLEFLKSPLWTPTGNPLSTLIILLLMLPFLAIIITKDKTTTDKLKLGFTALSLFLCVIAASLLGYRLFFQDQTNRPQFLPQATSWSIALESLKSSPLLGTGPATYLSDFTRFRPIEYNLTKIWSVRFSSSSNYYLQILSTLGLLGLAAYILFISRVFRLFINSFRTNPESSLHAITIASTSAAFIGLIINLIVPASIILEFTVFLLLIIAVITYKQLGSSLVHEANIDIVASSDGGAKSPILPWVGLLVALLFVLPTFYLTGVAYAAEVMFQNALTAAAANQGKTTYETLNKAIAANPYKDNYYVAFSQTNVLLADSIAASSKQLTDEQRNTASQLIQQAVNAAKNAATLNPLNVTNLENLAAIYRNLIPLAKDADLWTKASYQQAIALDPVNPNLRIALGGVLYSLKDYPNAIALFQQATQLKPDLANGFYNLSAAYRESGDYQNALTAMQTVLTLLDKNSTDYPKAQDEAAALSKKLGEANPTPTPAPEPAKSELQAPPPIPTSNINPPLPLPTGLAPVTSTTPAVTPSPSISPTPTP